LTFSKIFILGAGAIGSVYGALVSERNDVTLIGNKAHVEAINAKGLSIADDVKKTFHPKAETEINSIPKKALVILATKTYDSARAIEGVKRLLKKDTVILILQNGLGNEDIVRRIVGDRSKVLRGVTKMASEFLKPGKIRFWSGETIIESNEESAKIVEIFNECGLKTRLSEDIGREVWIKLVVNCVVNPLTALFRVRNCAIWGDSLRMVRHGVVRECVEVAKAEGIALPENLAERIDKQVSSYTNFSSMYQDIAKGKKTEIDFLNGKIVDLGKRHHIQTPINETLVSFIKFLEDKNGIPRKD
jgi:2-dehydropantoate 2-reductase